jgi:hypothetical protein
MLGLLEMMGHLVQLGLQVLELKELKELKEIRVRLDLRVLEFQVLLDLKVSELWALLDQKEKQQIQVLRGIQVQRALLDTQVIQVLQEIRDQ